jgi:hypothetical protein
LWSKNSIQSAWILAEAATALSREVLLQVEIAAALKQNVPVIPILVQNAAMPIADELPEDIRNLAFHSGLKLSPEFWKAGVERLLRDLDKVMAKRTEGEQQLSATSAFSGRVVWIQRRRSEARIDARLFFFPREQTRRAIAIHDGRRDDKLAIPEPFLCHLKLRDHVLRNLDREQAGAFRSPILVQRDVGQPHATKRPVETVGSRSEAVTDDRIAMWRSVIQAHA